MSFREQRLAPLPVTFVHFEEPKETGLRRSHSYSGYVPFEPMTEHPLDPGDAGASPEEPWPEADGDAQTRSGMPGLATPQHTELDAAAMDPAAGPSTEAAAEPAADAADAAVSWDASKALCLCSGAEAAVSQGDGDRRGHVEETEVPGAKPEITEGLRRVRICNLSEDVTQTSVMEAIDRLGFSGQYELCSFFQGFDSSHAALNFGSAALAYKFQAGGGGVGGGEWGVGWGGGDCHL